jgi:hypothetical protein
MATKKTPEKPTKTKKTEPAKKSAATKSQTEKPAAKAAKADQPRVISKPKYASFKLQKRITQTGPALPSAYSIFKQTLGTLKGNWKVFLGITLWYGIVNMILVQSLTSGVNVDQARSSFEGMLNGTLGHVAAGAASFVYLLGTSGNSASSTAGSYQLIWIIITSLAFIWVMRQVFNDTKVRVRDGFYRGMYPLIPFVFVLIIIALQLTPMIIGGSLFSSSATTGLTSSFVDTFVWSALFVLLTVFSLYMVTSSIFALYIVSLPDMAPLAALRSAKQLVANRRWTIMRKILFLPFALLLIGALIMVPLILVLPAVASWLLFVLLMICVPIMHSYLYTLYRTLL